MRTDGPDRAADLTCAGRVVARYVWAPDLPRRVSPRPYLHPVTTLGGTPVTGFRPADHSHHLGASVAVPVLNDANFWGGRTYVRGRGPVDLDNHGVQRHSRWLHRSPGHLIQELEWLDRDGAFVAREERALDTHAVSDKAWLLRVTFAVSGDTTLTIDSPGARGRTGAGYGGFFWRAPPGPARVRVFGAGDAPGDLPGAVGAGGAGRVSPGGAGATVGGSGGRAGSARENQWVTRVSRPDVTDRPVHDVHGTCREWVALSAGPPGPWTLVFLSDPARPPDPWFVRAADYAGVCPALAWDRPLVVAAGGTLTRRVGVLVADGALTVAAVETAVAAARDLLA